MNLRGLESTTMNAIDILGGMLGRKSGQSGGGGIGGAILESILKGRRGGASSSSGGQDSIPQRPAGSPRIKDTSGHGQEFDSLEDLLRHAHQRNTSSRKTTQQRNPFPQPEPRVQQRQTDFTAEYESDPVPFNRQAEVLVRAMVNAAKADGQIDQQEQDAIIKELGNVSQAEVDFLRSEFAKPLDVREFVWSVPLGMERQIYAVSLMAINLDQNSEAQYLRELGHGFRMDLETCNQIHREFNAPLLR